MKRKNKTIYIIFVFVGLFCISIGYAAINRTLNITGNSEVKENTWDIHFENLQVSTGSVTATTPPTVNGTNPSIGFSFQLDLPGDFYEFTVDVVNAGSIDAMIDSINKTPALTDIQAKYLNYIIEYQNGEQITTKQLVKAGEFVRLKVLVEYRTDLNEEDLPTITETLNLGFSINFVQADNTAINVKDNGLVKIEVDGSLNEIGTVVTIGTEQFYTIGTEGENVKLLSMYNLYVGNVVNNDNDVSNISNPTGMQSFEALGSIWIDFLEKNYPWVGGVEFSNDSQKGINYSDYNGSVVEIHVNNYKRLLERKFGINISSARLMRYEELIDPNTFKCDTYNCINSPYSFIYSTSYWLETAYENTRTWFVESDSLINYDYYYNNTFFGVRPVIVLSKEEILGEPQIIDIVIDGNTYQAEEGMTWEEWINSEYNLANATRESRYSETSRILNGGACEVLSYKESRVTIYTNEIIDKNQEYYYKSVGSCK